MTRSPIIEGSHLTKVVRHGTLYMLSSLLLKGGAAILLPLYTHLLDKEEYARFTNLMSIAAIAAVFISLHVDYAYRRLIFDTDNDRRGARQLFSTLLIFLLSWGTLAAVVTFLIVRHQASTMLSVPYYPHVLLACAIPLFMQLNLLASAHFQTQHGSTTVTGGRLLAFFGGAIVSVTLLLTTQLRAEALLCGALTGAVLAFVRYYYRLWRDGLIGLDFSFPRLRESLLYSLGLLPMAASAWISGHLDKLLITWRGSLGESGVYSVAFEIGRLMNVFVLSLFMVYTPMVYAMLKESAAQNIRRIERFQAFYIHALVALAFAISLFTPEVYELLIDRDYHGGIAVVPVVAFAFVFGGLRKLHATLIYYHKLTWLVSVGGLMQAGVSFGINYALIPTLGGMAAAWAKLVSMLLAAIYFYVLSRIYQPLRIDWRALGITLSVLGGGLALLAACVYVLQLSFWPLLAAKLVIVALAALFTWYSPFGEELRRAWSQRAAPAELAPETDEPSSD